MYLVLREEYMLTRAAEYREVQGVHAQCVSSQEQEIEQDHHARNPNVKTCSAAVHDDGSLSYACSLQKIDLYDLYGLLTSFLRFT